MEVTRELGTYADGYWLMYLLTALAAVLFVKGLRNRHRLWRLGKGERVEPLEKGVPRLLRVTAELFFHRRLLKRPLVGGAHLALAAGMLVFTVGTLSVMLQEHFGLPTFRGGYYLGLSLFLDLFALLGLMAIGVLYFRPRALPMLQRTFAERALLPLAAAVLGSGLLLEGLRMAMTPDPWGLWSPVGLAVAGAVTGIGIAVPEGLHRGVWWLHLVLSLGLIASVPYTRLIHMMAAPLSLYHKRPRSSSVLEPLDFVDPEVSRFGVGRMEDWHWKHLLETDACMQCGRCHESCPAATSGSPLSPQAFGNGVRAQLIACGENHDREEEGALLHSVGGDEALWACTTCGACDAACPVGVEQVSRLVDMRRNEVLMEARFPVSLHRMFKGLETQGNPWNLERRLRSEAAAELNIPLLSEAPDAEVLLWMGCSGAYDPKSRQVLGRLAEVLRRAGVHFATLGEQERCCADSARRLGNEYLFQSLARENIEALNGSGLRTIVTLCPHCTNVLGSEYPQFDGNFHVLHHTRFLAGLLRQNRIEIDGAAEGKTTFHDPCYLGRHGEVYDEPRELLRAARTQSILELKRSGADSFCCGAGGGLMWMDDGGGAIARERAREIAESGAEILCTACPFCRTMLSDALKEANPSIRVIDVVELVKGGSQESESGATNSFGPVPRS